jgi:hypothetical protein
VRPHGVAEIVHATDFRRSPDLARRTLRVFFEELAARIGRIEPMGALVHEANVFIKGVRRWDVRLQGRGDG